MTRLIWLLLLVSCSLAGKKIQEFYNHYGKYEGFKNCPGFNGPIRFENVQLVRINKYWFTVNTDFVVDVPIDDSFRIETSISMCPGAAARSFCSEFPRLDIYPCKNMTGGAEFFSLAFYGNNDTYLECPTKTGKFHLIGLEPDLVPRPIFEGYFILENKGYLHGELVMCYVFEVDVPYWMAAMVAGKTSKQPKNKSH